MLAAIAIVAAVGTAVTLGGLALTRRAAAPGAAAPGGGGPVLTGLVTPQAQAAPPSQPAAKPDTNATGAQPAGDQTMNDVLKTGGSILGAGVSIVGAVKAVVGLVGGGTGAAAGTGAAVGTGAAATGAAGGTGGTAGGTATLSGAAAGTASGLSASSAAAAGVYVAIIAAAAAVIMAHTLQAERNAQWNKWTRGGARKRYGAFMFHEEAKHVERVLLAGEIPHQLEFVKYLQHDGSGAYVYTPRHIGMPAVERDQLIAVLRYLNLERLRVRNDVLVNFYWRGRNVIPSMQERDGLCLENGDAQIQSIVDSFSAWRADYLANEWHADDLGYRLGVGDFATLESIARALGADALADEYRFMGVGGALAQICVDTFGTGYGQPYPGDDAFAQSIAVQSGLTDERLSWRDRWRLAKVDDDGTENVNGKWWALLCGYGTKRGWGFNLLETRRLAVAAPVSPPQRVTNIRSTVSPTGSTNAITLEGRVALL